MKGKVKMNWCDGDSRYKVKDIKMTPSGFHAKFRTKMDSGEWTDYSYLPGFFPFDRMISFKLKK